jgi:putative two-component system response regulator
MIPLAARIVTIADVYDALRMERSYKPALNHESTLQKMTEGKESHFDPFLVEVFTSVEKDFDNIYENNRDSKESRSPNS